MPDKHFKKGCGTTCIRCWRNKLKHANPQTKRWLAKNNKTLQSCYEDTLNYIEESKRVSPIKNKNEKLISAVPD